MSLLREIRQGAISSTLRVSELLRMCKILPFQLSSYELETWTDLELEGYTVDSQLPDYRILEDSVVRGTVVDPHAIHQPKEESLRIPRSPKWIEKASKRLSFRLGVPTYEDLLGSRNDTFIVEYLSDTLVAHFNRERYDGLQWDKLYRVAPRIKIVSLLNSVRNRILKFTMELEKENPDASEGHVKEILSPAPVINNYNNTIHSLGNLAQGSSGFQQDATVAPVAQQLNLDWSQLSEELPLLRERLRTTATDEEGYDAISGVVAAEKAVAAKDESKLVAGLKKAGKVALETAKEIGTNVAASVIAKSIGAG